VGTIVLLGVAAAGSVPHAAVVAIAWLVWGVRWMRGLRGATPGLAEQSVPEAAYQHLSDSGRATVATSRSLVLMLLIVLGWAALAVVAAVVISVAAFQLPLDATGRGIAGLMMVVSFVGVLLVGPLWTLRRLRRRRPD
jgi:hypothetical protein